MADNVIKFTSTRLANIGKQGVLTPDADGYYELVIGGLNVLNSANQYYTLKGAQELFEKSSIFMRRVQNGCLKAEVGHPKRTPGMSMDDYLDRILRIEETNVCGHFKDVWLDFDYGRKHPEIKNPAMVAIMGSFKPGGPKGEALKQSLDNKHENVCFSIRSLTRDYYVRGQCNREIATITTFDWVTEPGISAANKWNAPALESADENEFMTTDRLLSNVQRMANNVYAMESTKDIAAEIIQNVRNYSRDQKAPSFAKW